MSASADTPATTQPAAVDAASGGIDEAVAVDEVVDANDLRDTGRDGDDVGGRPELPLEADAADVLEQDAVVPYDDDER